MSDEWSPGRHSFSFEWQLPEDLPNSFEGSHGAVRFYARGILSVPGCRSSCQKCFVNTRYFTVLRHFDLNSRPAFAVIYVTRTRDPKSTLELPLGASVSHFALA